MTGPVRFKPPAIPGQEKSRSCLRCGKSFLSSWAGNRICQRCSDHEVFNEPDTVKRLRISAREG